MSPLHLANNAKRQLKAIALLFAFLTQGLLAQSSVFAADRAALLIGNQAYPTAPLQTPLNDVWAMKQSLQEAGFVVQVLEDARQNDFYEQVDHFFATNAGASVHLFFYSGHGIQLNGRNYLIPVEAKIDAPDVLSKLFDVRHLLERLQNTQASTRIVILDACRTNPFSRNPNASSGLSELIAPANTFVAFSTAPGTVADDGDTNNSPYTESLLTSLFTPGRKIEEAFKIVRRQVRQATDGSQIPWESTSLENDFVMVPLRTAEIAVLPAAKKGGKISGTAQLVGAVSSEINKNKTQCSRILTKLSMGFPPLTAAESSQLSACQ